MWAGWRLGAVANFYEDEYSYSKAKGSFLDSRVTDWTKKETHKLQLPL